MGYELSDEALAAVVPIVVFWVSVGVYELLAYMLPDSHLHIEEDVSKNTVSRWTVTKGALFNNTIQIALVSLVLTVTIIFINTYIHTCVHINIKAITKVGSICKG